MVHKCAKLLRVDELSPRQRAELGPVLYRIFCVSYGALDQQTVTDEIIFRPGGNLYIFTDAAGQVVGFSTSYYDRFAFAGQTHAVWNGGAYFVRGVRGGHRMLASSLLGPLKYKLRHPTHRVSMVVEALHPSTFRLASRVFPACYPSRTRETPAAVTRLVKYVLRRRGLKQSGQHPFVVRYPDPASHREPERLTYSKTLRDDPDVAHYLALNPNLMGGDILCLYAPYTLANIVRAVARAVVGAR